MKYIALTIFVISISLLIGFVLGIRSERDAAIEKGVAEYTITPQGKIGFHYVTPIK